MAASLAATLALWATPPGAKAQHGQELEMSEMTEIRIRIGGQDVIATLDDSPAARDFLSMLPLSLTLEDYASIEKVSDLPRRLITDSAPEGYKPSAGDITYYAPWGNLAIFYREFGYSRGLVRLGRVQGSVDPLATDTQLYVRIETAE